MRLGVRATLTKISAVLPLEPNSRPDTAGLLHEIDINRDRIYAIAGKVCARGRRGSYERNVADV